MKHPIICLSCGYDGDKLLRTRDDSKYAPAADTCRCPKCQNTAYVQNPLRSRFVIAALAQEIIRLKGDILELQVEADERINGPKE